MLKYVPFSQHFVETGYEIYDTETGRVLLSKGSTRGGVSGDRAADIGDARKIFKILEKHWN